MNSLILASYTVLIWFIGACYGAFIFEYRNQNRSLIEIGTEMIR